MTPLFALAIVFVAVASPTFLRRLDHESLGWAILAALGVAVAWYLKQPRFATGGIILFLLVAHILKNLMFLILIGKPSSSLLRHLPWPRRIPAEQITTAYADPIFPTESEQISHGAPERPPCEIAG